MIESRRARTSARCAGLGACVFVSFQGLPQQSRGWVCLSHRGTRSTCRGGACKTAGGQVRARMAGAEQRSRPRGIAPQQGGATRGCRAPSIGALRSNVPALQGRGPEPPLGGERHREPGLQGRAPEVERHGLPTRSLARSRHGNWIVNIVKNNSSGTRGQRSRTRPIHPCKFPAPAAAKRCPSPPVRRSRHGSHGSSPRSRRTRTTRRHVVRC